MIGFRDKTFCTRSDCARFGKDCDRSLTDEVKKQAEYWWGGPGAPVCTFHPNETPDCFVEENEIEKL